MAFPFNLRAIAGRPFVQGGGSCSSPVYHAGLVFAPAREPDLWAEESNSANISFDLGPEIGARASFLIH